MQIVLGYLFLILATLCWSTTGPLGLFALNAGITPVENSFWRAIFAFIIFATHAALLNKWRLPFRVAGACFLFGCVGMAGISITNNIALLGAGAAMGSMLQNGVAPVFTAFLGVIFFKEYLSQWRIMAVILTVSGLVLICVSGGGLVQGAAWWGVAAGIVSGFCYSLQFVFFKNLLNRYAGIALFMYMFLGTALVMFPFVDFMPDKTPEIWIYLFIPAIVVSWCGTQAYGAGLKRLEISRAGVIITIEPLFAAFLAWLIWGEMFSLMGWIGTIAIILGIMLTTIEKKRRSLKNDKAVECSTMNASDKNTIVERSA